MFAGTTVVSAKAFNRISAEDRVIVREVMGRANRELDATSRSDNAEAREALARQGVEFVDPTDETRAKWEEIAAAATKKAGRAKGLQSSDDDHDRRTRGGLPIAATVRHDRRLIWSGPEPSVVSRLLRVTALVEDALLVLILAAMVGLAATQIVLRNLFDGAILWADPMLRVGVLWVGMIGAMVATRSDKQISVDAVSRFLPMRWKARVRIVTDMFTAGVSAVVAWSALRLVLDDRAAGIDGGRVRAGVGLRGDPSGGLRSDCYSVSSLCYQTPENERRRTRMCRDPRRNRTDAARDPRCTAVRDHRGRRTDRFRGFGDRPDGRADGDLQGFRNPGPDCHPTLHLCRLPAGREPGSAASGQGDQRVAGVDAGRPCGGRAVCLRSLHRLHRGLWGHDHRDGGPVVSGDRSRGLSRRIQPRSDHHLRQPRAALRALAAPDPLRHHRRAVGGRSLRRRESCPVC